MVPTSVKDAYRILGISEGASPDEIKNAYRTTALKWHPDRHHSRYDKELATRYFAEATNAYRTLVREGYLKYRKVPVVNDMPEVQRPPLMQQKSSSQSSLSLDSFIHLVASSTESHTTPSSSNRESPRSSWKQGIRNPSETIASQYRNTAPPVNNFHYESPQRGTKGPAMYKHVPTAQFHDQQKRPEASKSPSAPTKLRGVHQRIPHQNQAPSSVNHHNFRQPQDHPRDHANRRNNLPPYSLPLRSIGLAHSGEWVYSIALTLEELFAGKHCHFGITRYYVSGRSKNVVIEIDIPAGCRPGTRILCRNVGHEWKPNCFQDIAFVIEDSPHDRFIRLFDDLIMDVRVPWVDSLKRQGGKVPFVGIDGRNLVVQIDYPRDKNMKGRSIIKGAGMPIREGGQIVGRGNMVVQWEILPPKTKILLFMKQLWGFGFRGRS
ncbi:DnaJ-domain-containing protein [Phlegmacium glaucopus]|nr:DnaJ-domain-containing protein [Phlegmacium glaucopus]